jgi:TRAP-type C4-dicarboxylate transport system substrate-binding protein
MSTTTCRRIFRFGLTAAVMACSLAGAVTVRGATTITVGTLAPEGTSYHKALLQMRDQWRAASGGNVNLRIYAGGKIGGDAKMVGQMRLGALDAGLLTSVGLMNIEQAVTGLQIMPMMLRSLEELDYVSEKLAPMLEQKIEAKGFVVLFWADTGWVRFFSKEPLRRPADLRKMKLFTWAGDTKTVELWKSGGFQPVPLETADIAPMLDTGLINAVPAPPVAALANMMYERAPHMLELNWAPLIGALVIRKAAWEKIPANVRAELLKVAAATGRTMKDHGRAESGRSVKAMIERGLKAHPVTPELEAEWRQAAEDFYPRIKGNLVPADIWEEVQRHLKEYRSTGGKAKP